MSLRKQAIILGITPSYLSMLVNGKRKWPDALRHRYEELVNSVVNTPETDSSVTNVSNRNLYLKDGRGEWIRTPDPLLAKQCLTN